MSYTLFISDLHLCEDQPDITQAFKSLLNGAAKKADKLYILGDFFDTWIGDRDRSAFNEDIIKTLHQFTSQTKIPTYFMHGNRDFLIGRQFIKKTGMTLLADPTLISLYGQPVLLMHGDTLCIKDTKYLKFRKLSRHPLFKLTNTLTPLWLRRRIAANLRQKSKDHFKSLKDKSITDACPDEIDRVMKAHHIDRLIHGHTHRPKIHDNGRIVLGAWHHAASVLYAYDDKSFDLKTIPFT